MPNNKRERLIKILNYVADNVLLFNTDGFIKNFADYLLKNDVEPVVRCKDCEYWKNNDCRKDIALVSPNENDYCSYGKRRDT